MPPGDFDIHYRRKRLESSKKKLLEANISERNKKLILEFVKQKTLVNDVGIQRQVKYLIYLRTLAKELGKDFDRASKEDIENLVIKIINNKKLKDWTKYDLLNMLRVFYRWLRDTEGYPEEVKWIKPKKPAISRLRPDETLTWEDILKLSNAAMNPRDKALVQVLFESGARIEELLTLQLRDIEIVEGGQAIKLHFRKSKTEIRSPIIIRSAPALINWLENHPRKKDKLAYLWVKIDKPDKPLDYSAARKVLVTLKKRSGLDKPVNPHNFRKSSASFYSHYLSPSELKKRFGWKQSSRMLDVYCFPDEERVNHKLLELEGIRVESKPKENPDLKPKKCEWCGKLNPLGQEFCILCKRPLLNPEENLKVLELRELIDHSLVEFSKQHPELLNSYLEFMRKKLMERGLGL